jgi:hypothetical protein
VVNILKLPVNERRFIPIINNENHTQKSKRSRRDRLFSTKSGRVIFCRTSLPRLSAKILRKRGMRRYPIILKNATKVQESIHPIE